MSTFCPVPVMCRLIIYLSNIEGGEDVNRYSLVCSIKVVFLLVVHPNYEYPQIGCIWVMVGHKIKNIIFLISKTFPW